MNNARTPGFFSHARIYLVCLAFSVLLPYAMGISEGDSIDDVVEAFGQPSGVMRRGAELYLTYGRGHVIIKDGKVSSLKMISQQELAEQERAHKKQLAKEKARTDQKIAERTARGKARKAETLEDEEFAELPAKNRLDFWKKFQAEFPEVSVTQEIKDVSMEIHAEKMERINEEIEDLKKQVAEAETQSRMADEWRVRRQARRDFPELEKKLENALKEKARLEQGL